MTWARRAPTLLLFAIACLTIFLSRLDRPQAAELPEVSSLHPRIFVRHDEASVGRGLTVGQLRQRLSDSAYQRWRGRVAQKDLVGKPGLSETVEFAARYLEEGDKDDLEAVRHYLVANTFSYAKHDVTGFLAGAEMATAFDWVYDGLSPSDRAAIMSNIVTTADSSYDFLIKGEPDINHNYTYMALNSIAVCGLVLEGEAAPFDARAREYLELARQWLEGKGKALDTWQAREGAWGEGNHYTFHETLRTLVMTLQAYRTATATDYFALIERQHGDFAAKAGRFLIASTRPDLTFERIGDISPSRVMAAITVPLTVDALAAGLGDTDDAARLRSFADALLEAYGARALHPSFDWGMRIFFEPRARREPSYKTLPLAMRMGAGTYDLITFRNGWDSDSTMISFLGGDHYTDHQHFDKGHFLIYRRGGLIVDGGAYDEMNKPQGHWSDYSTRTLAHNGVLVYDPDEAFPKGYSNDGGQRVLRGLQHHADWQNYLEHYKKEKLDTGEVLAFESGEQFGYARCDLARAYSDKVTAYDRQLVYLPADDFLLVYDRVSAARPEFNKRWLLHFQEQPVIGGVAPKPGVSRFANASLMSVKRRGSLDQGGRKVAYDGALFVNTLLPAQRSVTTIGGEGYEFFDAFAGVNHPPSDLKRADELREAGRWRIEVAPARPARSDRFLHAFQIADGATKQPVRVRLLTSDEGKMVGAQFLARRKHQVVLFAKNQPDSPVSLPLRYTLSSPVTAHHLLVELPPGQRVAVEINGKPSPVQRVSSQGVLEFEDRVTGQRKVVIRPVPN